MTTGVITVTNVEEFKEEYLAKLVGELASSTLEYLQKYAENIETGYEETIKELLNDLPSHSELIQEDILFAFSKALCEVIEYISYDILPEMNSSANRHGPRFYEPLANGEQPIFALVDYDEMPMVIDIETTIESLLLDESIEFMIDDTKQQIRGHLNTK